jgi:hypothetical protein
MSDNPQFQVRVHAGEEAQHLIQRGSYRPHWPAPGLGWWANGALVVDRDGAALIDADGMAHRFPAGAALLCNVEGIRMGTAGPTHSLFVTDADHRVLLRLPSVADGWAENELKEFAGHAGLAYEFCWMDDADIMALFPPVPEDTRSVPGDLRPATT